MKLNRRVLLERLLHFRAGYKCEPGFGVGVGVKNSSEEKCERLYNYQ